MIAEDKNLTFFSGIEIDPATFLFGTRDLILVFDDELHAEESFPNLIKSNRNQIAYTIIRLIWNKTDVSLVPN